MCGLELGAHAALCADVSQIARQAIADVNETMEHAMLAEILRLAQTWTWAPVTPEDLRGG
jgi:hypothetical protein